MTGPKITLYFDIVSPFSYIAFHVLKTSPVFSECQIEYVPILLRDLLQRCQNPPPIGVKNKFQWINKERLYWSDRFNVPMSIPIPEGFPAPTVDLQIALAGVSIQAPEQLTTLTERFYSIFWAEGNTKITNQEVFQPILQHELPDNGVSDLINEHSKEVLGKNTEIAFNGGAFGLPWLVCTNSEGQTEGFWGIDHLGRVADFLHLDTSSDKAFNSLL
ncbi:hypothetical protein PENSTE_c018G04763 [Penicillium steckii]|uniref:Glutathione S-transferase kappa n=1 Tax=Penicillium steckii TaxID=303698 RepID=A0A1V6SWI9_9EURO|nr:hypothetical protein PENSTE_c018G04763 [Penicillium steckii]